MSRVNKATSQPKRKQGHSVRESSFEFVNAIPGSAAEFAKSRSLVRSNATKYQWKTSKQKFRKNVARKAEPEEVDKTIESFDQPSDSQAEPQAGPTEVEVHRNASGRLQKGVCTKDNRRRRRWRGVAFPAEWDSGAEKEFSAKDKNVRPPWTTMYPSPGDILSASTVDPFNAFPLSPLDKTIGRMIEDTREVILPRLCPYPGDSFLNSCVQFWIPRVSTSKALFEVFMYGSLVFSRVRSGHYAPDREVQIAHANGIRELNVQMKDPMNAASPDNILAVCILATNMMGSTPRTGKLPKQAPLQGLQSLDIYGLLDLNETHLKGMMKMVEMRGGIQNLSGGSLSAMLSYVSVSIATRTLTPPILPFIPFINYHGAGHDSDELGRLPSQSPSPELISLGTGFSELSHACKQMPSFGDVVQTMVNYTRLADDYAQGRYIQVPVIAIANHRNQTQHRLMSLPSASSVQPDPRELEPMYEACRLATIIYSLLVVFPFPASNGPFPRLASLLREELKGSVVQRPWPKFARLMLWILFMGAISSTGWETKPWFVEAIAGLVCRLEISTYERVRETLQDFLWLASTNDNDGLEIWGEVLQYKYERGLR